MARRFRLRIAKALPSFRSCRSPKEQLPHTVDDGLLRPYLSPPVPSPPPPTPPRAQHRRGRVPVVASSGCICRSFSRPAMPKSQSPAGAELAEVIPAYLWKEEDRWHVVVNTDAQSLRRKIDSDDANDLLFPPLSIPRPSYRTSKSKSEVPGGKEAKNKKKARARARPSTSSADSRLFSSDEDREYEEEYDFEGDEGGTLICSSNSFSTEGEQTRGRHPRGRRRRRQRASPGTTESSPRRPSVSALLLRWMSSCRAVEGKVRESVAVVKRSEDPYEDFRRSMMEMVLEKQIYEAAELEQLLHCFLSLNSGDHHDTILMAFSEILGALSTAASHSPPCK